MLLNDVKWEKPVTISLENGAPRIFNGVYEAFDFLQHEWPERGDKVHEQALRLCRASLMGGPVHSLSPLVAAVYRKCALLDIELADLQRYAWKYALGLCGVLITAALVFGVIPLVAG